MDATVPGAASGRTFTSINPATGATPGEAPDCSAADMTAAVDSAAATLPGWRHTPLPPSPGAGSSAAPESSSWNGPRTWPG